MYRITHRMHFFLKENSNQKIIFTLLIGQEYFHTECKYHLAKSDPHIFLVEVEFND